MIFQEDAAQKTLKVLLPLQLYSVWLKNKKERKKDYERISNQLWKFFIEVPADQF